MMQFQATLRNGQIAICFPIKSGQCVKPYRIAGRIPPHAIGDDQLWRIDGRWLEDGTDHNLDIVQTTPRWRFIATRTMSQLSTLTKLQRAYDNSEDPLYWRSQDEPEVKPDMLQVETRNNRITLWAKNSKAISVLVSDLESGEQVELDAPDIELITKIAKEVGIL